MKEIYLDNAATTRPWPEVIDEINGAMTDSFGNASSLHKRGLGAMRKISQAILSIKGLLEDPNWNVLFTSGGSESDTMAVIGSVPRGKRDTVIASSVEHEAVTASCKLVESKGGRYFQVSAGKTGVINPSELAALVDERTALVSLTHVANEMGTVQPVNEAARLVKQKYPRLLFHVDAVQSAAQLKKLDLSTDVDMVSLSAHKIHGPQGVGALLVRPNVKPRPLICGGDQQQGLRPGTLNLPGIMGFGRAADLVTTRRNNATPKMILLTDKLVTDLTSNSSGVRLLGDPNHRAPGLAVLAIEEVQSEVLLHALEAEGLLASSGAACHSSRKNPPRCLVDAGLTPSDGSIRFSLTFDTTEEEIERAGYIFAKTLQRVRAGNTRA